MTTVESKPKYQVFERVHDEVACRQADDERLRQLATWHADDRTVEVREVRAWTAD